MITPKVDADTAGIRNSLNESFVSNSAGGGGGASGPRPDAGWSRTSDVGKPALIRVILKLASNGS